MEIDGVILVSAVRQAAETSSQVPVPRWDPAMIPVSKLPSYDGTDAPA